MDQQLARRQTSEVTGPVATITQGFGTKEIAMRGERASEAVAARETAAVQARFIYAMRNPRDVMDFRARLLHECQRPGFADTAMYRKPVGKKDGKQTYAEGPSIRMIECCIQMFKNVEAVSSIVYDGPDMRLVTVSVVDLENNTSYRIDLSIPKTTEKRGYGGKPPEGREVLGERLNSFGEQTYIVVATEAEVVLKQAAEVSKAVRTCGQRLLPGDIIAEAVAQIRATVLDRAKKDPDGEKKAVMDAFATLSIMPSDLAALVGHSLDRLTPVEIAGLRDTYRTIRNGESTWDEIMAAENTTPEPELQAETRARLIAEAEANRKQPTVTPIEETTSESAPEPADDMGASRYEKPETKKRKGFE